MTILALPAPRVQPTIEAEWIGQHEQTPVEALTFPGTAEDLIDLIDRPDDQARYVVVPKRSETLGRTIWHVVDRAEDGALVAWYGTREMAEDRAADENAEDWPDLGDWWNTAGPCEHFDGWKISPTRI